MEQKLIKKYKASISGIRYVQKTETYKVPKSAQKLMMDIIDGKIDTEIQLGKTKDILLQYIKNNLNVILQDGLFAGINYYRIHWRKNLKTTLEQDILKGLSLLLEWTAKVNWKYAKIVDAEIVANERFDWKTEYKGIKEEGVGEGQTRIKCTIEFGKKQIKVFPKFIIHPFYQYSKTGITDM